MPGTISTQHPKEYLHKDCGYTTIMPDEVIQQYLQDPFSVGSNTFCAYCRKQVPDRDCTWVETGEALDNYMRRLQQSHVPVAAVEQSRGTIDFHVKGFLRYLAIVLFFVGVILPIDSSYRDGLLLNEPESRPAPRFGGLRSRFQEQPQENTIPWYFKTLAVVSSILALMLYMPRWGFKRYALVAGPIVGLGSFWILSYWLTGRTSIYRFEPVLVSMIGALPGILLWVMLVRNKAHRRGLLIASHAS